MEVHDMACDVHYLQPRSHLGCARLGITAALRAYAWYERAVPDS